MKNLIRLGLAALALLAAPLANAWNYTDGDALLVFHKAGYNDVEFDLGSVNQFLNQSGGYATAVTGWDASLVTGTYGADLTGVKVVLVATTPKDTVNTANNIAWLTSAGASSSVSDVTPSTWNGLYSTINGIGVKPGIYDSSNYPAAYSLASVNLGSYEYVVAGTPGNPPTINQTTLPKFGGRTPFNVEQAAPGTLQLWAVHATSTNPKPASTLIGYLTISSNGLLDFSVSAPVSAPAFNTTLADQVQAVGSTVTFTADATGGALSYQWQKNGINLTDSDNVSGSATATLTLSNVSDSDAATYSVVIVNAAGSTTASAALSVIDPPVIATSPASQTYNAGDTATFTVTTSSGTTPFTYAWYKGATQLTDGGNVSGSSTATLTLNNVQDSDVADYTVVLSNAAGSVTSAPPVYLTVIDPPVVATAPASITNNAGTTATFTVTTSSGTTPFTYAWFKGATQLADSGNVSGSSTATLTLTGVLAADAANYSVVIANAAGSVTNTTSLTVIDPAITSQPASTSVAVSNNATFSVTAVGTATLSYQWKLNNVNIPGATNSTLVVSNVQTAFDGRVYSVVVTSPGGTATSANAKLTVTATDAVKPAVAVLSPAANATVFSANTKFSGTAADNIYVKDVQVSVNNGAFASSIVARPTAKTANWNNTVTLVAGTNTVVVKAIDLGGNSTAVTNKYFYAVSTAFTVVTNTDGAGTVVIKPGLPAYIGRTYTITATPGATSLLSNIVNAATSGTTITPNSTPLKALKNVTVLAQASNTVTINFVTNRFIAAAGGYNGLFTDTNHGVTEASAGFLTVKTTGKLTYSGSLNVDGDVIKGLAGTFDLNGASTTNVSRSTLGKSSLVVTLQLGFDGKLSGTVSNAATAGWISTVDADQAPTSTALNGSYTLLIPGFDYATNGPIGDGYATITIKPAGTVTATGFTSDNQAFTPQTAPVSGSGRWPVYAPLYVTAGGGHNGVVIGWVQFTGNAPTATFSGDLNWIKTGWTNTYYAGGFTNLNVTAPGSVFTAPAALSFFNGATATYSGGEFAGLLTDKLSVVGAAVKATNSPATVVGGKYAFVPATGVLTVTKSTNNPALKLNPIKGAYLQNQNYIGGYFLGTNQAGQLLVQ